jgi:hypothetical protein
VFTKEQDMDWRKNNNTERVRFSSDLLDFFSSRLSSTHATFFTGHLRSGMMVLDDGEEGG